MAARAPDAEALDAAKKLFGLQDLVCDGVAGWVA
jgi:hypothetical protein